jgi:tetratricopeptide (TPR) repeat protein
VKTEAETFESEIFESGNFDEATQFRSLLRAIEFSDSFSLLFARCNQRPSQKKLIEKLKAGFPDKKIEVVFFNQPIKHLLDELRNFLTASKADLVLVYGLESSVTSVKNAKQNVFIKNLNASRNSFPNIFNCPVVLFLPEYIISAIMLGATDFFSVRSGVFYFESESETVNLQSQQVNLINDYEIGSLSIVEREARIQNIEELLREKQSDENQIKLHLNLSELYNFQANYKKAEIECNLALKLAIKENNKLLEAETYNNLALLYQTQGRYAEAEPLYLKALAIREKELGKNHPSTATSYNNLASLYKTQGRYAEAEPLYLKALAIREKELGENHPLTATSYNNLASLYKSQGRYAEAEPLYLKALAIREKELGENHPLTAGSYNNLAGLYESQGRYAEAEPLYLKALAISEKELGENHPDTATSYNNLGFLYANQGKYAEAKVWLTKALIVRETVLGNNHPYTIGTRQSLENVEEML